MLKTSTNIQELISRLESPDGFKRQEARDSLVRIGKPAVPALAKALSQSTYWGRWEIAMALSDIGEPSSAAALVEALEDENSGVRWLSAAGLIKIGRAALGPLMQVLAQRADSIWLRESAHHILHDLRDKKLLRERELEVYHALRAPAPDLEVPWIAEAALKELTGDTETS
jgi:HEAT repeat protein